MHKSEINVYTSDGKRVPFEEFATDREMLIGQEEAETLERRNLSRNNQHAKDLLQQRKVVEELELLERRNLTKINKIDQTIITLRKISEDIDLGIGRERVRNDRQNSLTCREYSYGTIAAGTGAEKSVFVSPEECKLSDLRLVNTSALAADPSNNTKLELINKGIDGLGTAVLATFDSATEFFVAYKSITKTLSGTILPKDTVLALKKTDEGTGAGVTDLFLSIGYTPII